MGVDGPELSTFQGGSMEKEREVMEMDRPGINQMAAKGMKTLEVELGADRTKGFPEAKVKELQGTYGLNKLQADSKEPIWKVFLDEFKSFVVIMLLVAAILCLALAVWTEGVAIVIIVFFNACLGTYMSVSAGNALEALAKMAAPTCNVIRDGKENSIPAEELVPGDLVVIKTGNQVPADIRMLEVNELQADEAPLTGESEPILKCLAPPDSELDSPFAKNMVFASTLIVNGVGKGLVVKTGMKTEVGKIAEGVKETKQQTPLQLALDRLGGQIGAMASSVLISIIIFAWLVDYNDPAHPDYKKFMKLILMGVTFAVSAIPEGLPMVVTICLSIGCKDMVKRKAQVRKLPAVETLGSCSVICSDKTGTLTEGKMTLVKLTTFQRAQPGETEMDEQGQGNSGFYSFWPTKGFNPNGGCFETSDLTSQAEEAVLKTFASGDVTVHRPKENYNEACTDFGDPDGPSKDTAKSQTVRACMLAAYLNSYETTYFYDPEKQMFQTKGNMSEAAIVVGAAKCRFLQDDTSVRTSYARNGDLEVPFSSSRKMAATVHKLPNPGMFHTVKMTVGNGPSEPITHVAVVKGAPDKLFPWLRYLTCESNGGIYVDDACPISHPELTEITDTNRQFSEQALRVLAVCLRPLTATDMQTLAGMKDGAARLDYYIGNTPGNKAGVGELILLGLLGSVDPPRAGVREAVERCRGAGCRVIMITGDQKITACAIAKNIAILQHGDTIEEKAFACADLHYADGSMIEQNLLDQITYRANVFSRAQPEDKMAIVDSLQRQGFVVAMTGDGVNDSPALKKADIGIGMGLTGTDVAKGASDMVLTDDNFCSIVSAVEEGRKIYSNIQKFVCFLLGTNIGEIFYLTIAVLADLPLPVFGLQVLFLNLFTDGGPAVALTMEPADGDIMDQPPRSKKANIMTKDCMWWINMPHQCGITAMVIGVTITAMWMNTGLIQQSKIQRLCEYMTDESWPDWDAKKCVEDISCPYYCMCREWNGADWETLEDGSKPYGIETNGEVVSRDREPQLETNYFGPATASGDGDTTQKAAVVVKRMEGWTFEEWINRTQYEVIFQTDDPPVWPLSTISQEPRLHVSKGVHIVPGKSAVDPETPETKEFKKNAKIIKKNCMTKGLTYGRSTAFITAVMCEMLRAYTVRSVAPASSVFFRNNWMHFACTVSFTLTLLLTIIPGIKDIFKLDTPRWFYYFIAVIFALGCAANDEIFKGIYRRVLAKRRVSDVGSEERREIKDRVEVVVEMLHKVTDTTFKNENDTTDLKTTLARLTKDIQDLKETSGAPMRKPSKEGFTVVKKTMV